MTQKYSEFWLVRYNAGYCYYFTFTILYIWSLLQIRSDSTFQVNQKCKVRSWNCVSHVRWEYLGTLRLACTCIIQLSRYCMKCSWLGLMFNLILFSWHCLSCCWRLFCPTHSSSSMISTISNVSLKASSPVQQRLCGWRDEISESIFQKLTSYQDHN